MESHKGKRLFITGIPTSGKSYLARKLAKKTGGIAICLDDYREELAKDEKYRKWVNFYLDQDEEKYLTQTASNELWNNLVRQSEALWPVFLEKIQSYRNEPRPVIFECVSMLPHLMKRDLDFPGVVLLNSSYENILKRNIDNPRWGNTRELQKLEAKTFWEVERPHYKEEAGKYGLPVFESVNASIQTALSFL